MNIERINNRHFIETDIYYRMEVGLSSRLLKVENGIFHLELTIGDRWNKSYNTAAAELAYKWKEGNEELKNCFGCKIYIIDTKKYPYKKYLSLHEIDPGYDARKGILFHRHQLN